MNKKKEELVNIYLNNLSKFTKEDLYMFLACVLISTPHINYVVTSEFFYKSLFLFINCFVGLSILIYIIMYVIEILILYYADGIKINYKTIKQYRFIFALTLGVIAILL